MTSWQEKTDTKRRVKNGGRPVENIPKEIY